MIPLNLSLHRPRWTTIVITYLLLGWLLPATARAAPEPSKELAQLLAAPRPILPQPQKTPSLQKGVCEQVLENTEWSVEDLKDKLRLRRAPPTSDAALAKLLAKLDSAVGSASARVGLSEEHIRALLETCPLRESSSVALAGTAAGVVGMPWQAMVVTGLANFVADRAQQELVLWLQQQLFDKLCHDKAEPIGALVFTNTCQAIDKISQAPAALGKYFAGMVRKDLEHAPAVLAYLALKETLPGAEADQLLPVIGRVTGLVLAMRNGESPLELVAALADVASELKVSCKGSQGNVPCTVALVGLWVKYLGNIRPAVLNRAALSNSAALREQIKAVLLDKSFQAAMKATFAAVEPSPWVAPFVTAFLKALPDSEPAAVEAALAALGLPSATSGGTSTVNPVLQKLLTDIYDLQQRLQKVSDLQDRGTAFRIEWAADISRRTLLVIDGSARLLTSADQTKLLETVEILEHAFSALSAFTRGDYPEGLRETLACIGPFADKLPKSVQQFLPLMADLAAAQSVEEVQTALNAAAAPLGSWRVKRQQGFSVSISALAGLSGGWELPMSSRLSFVSNSGLAGGPLAALGLDLAWRVRQSSWTTGLFVSVLDLGQLAYARIASSDSNNAKASTESDVSFLNVLSPGAFLRIGAGNTPLTFGVGGSVAPQMRQYLFTTSGVEDKSLFSMFRLMAFVAVDVTLFRIH